jgi:hypothetical protein
MALYSDLPVFKKAYDLLLAVYKMTGSLSREYKYTIGEKLKNEMLELLLRIYRANLGWEKAVDIDRCRESAETVRLMVRVLYDLKQINMKKMIALNALIENISKQLSGWRKSAGKGASGYQKGAV